MPAATGITAARRLTLTAPEWTLLYRRAGIRPPDGFGAEEPPEPEVGAAARSLSARGILTAGGAPTRPVSANLTVWAAPQALVRAELAVRGRGLRAAYAVAGQLGASLFTLAGGGVELSLFPATALGRELVRCVSQPPEQLAAQGWIGEALAGSGAAPAPVRGRLPLSALAEYAPTSGFTEPGAVATALGLTAAEAALAREVTGRTAGVLRCLAVGPAGGAGAAGGVLAAEVVWLLTDAGWVGLRPHPDGSGRQLVDLVPVDRTEIGGWLAPYLARILEVAEPELEISGGAGGTYARLEDIELLADHSEQLGQDLAGVALESHGLLAHPDVLASAVLNPDGVVRFEAALLGALDGSDGLSAMAAELGTHAVTLRVTAASYRAVDQAQAELVDAARWGAGQLLGNPVIGGPVLAGTAGLGWLGHELGVDWQEVLTEHPGIVDTLVGMGPGLITGLPGPLLATDVESASRLLAMLYPDGAATVEDIGVDAGDPLGNRPPAGFEDLLTGLDHRSQQATGEDQGQIDVRVLSHPDGTRSYIVDIPGTRDWHPAPLNEYEKLNDLGTNLHAMGGDETAYQQGVVEALRRAGAGADEPVMLVGHSQGGIVATRAAADLSAGGELNVTHVVTAGSPVGHIDVPGGVQVLSLENRHDIVPHLDATDNPDRPNQVTVGFDTQHGAIGGNHGIGSAYLPAAAALDGSTDPSVAAYRDSAGAFFAGDGSTVTSHVYEIERTYE